MLSYLAKTSLDIKTRPIQTIRRNLPDYKLNRSFISYFRLNTVIT